MKPGYKQTEIGVIPEDWDAVTFSTCFQVLKNNTLARAELNYDAGTVKSIHYGDILIKYRSLLDADSDKIPYITEPSKRVPLSYLQDGDLIIADTAEDETVGKAVELKGATGQKIVAGLHTIPCRSADRDMFANGWLGYFINHSIFHDQLLPLITGTKVSAISKSALANTVVLVPNDKKEQERIAEALSDADDLISSLEKLIEKKKDIKQGAMQQLLTGKTRLPGFCKEWKTQKWGEVLEGFISGATPFRGQSSYYIGKNKWVSSGELNYNHIVETKEHISDLAIRETSLVLHPAGTFLMAITGLEAEGTRGSCAMLDCVATTNQSCLAIYGTKTLDINFLYHYYVLKGNELAFQYCQGTKQQSYTATIVKSLPIVYPSDTQEQVAISSILSDMDDEINQLESKLEKARQVKQGMMQQLLIGKIRFLYDCEVNRNGEK